MNLKNNKNSLKVYQFLMNLSKRGGG